MSQRMIKLLAAAAVLSVGCVVAASALAGPTTPIPEDKQASLLEKFGDQDIDADGDGVLTHDEVKTFFADRHGQKGHRRHGMAEGFGHGMKGDMHCGMMGGMMGGMHHGMMGHMDYTEMTGEQLASMLKHHPEADADADGLLSEDEFGTFRALRMAEHRVKLLERHPEADVDGDGALSEDEFEALHILRVAEHLAKMLEHHPEADTDGDGTLSEEEVSVFKADSHHQGLGCGAGSAYGHGGYAGHKDKGHGKCAGHKDGGSGLHEGHGHKQHEGWAKSK